MESKKVYLRYTTLDGLVSKLERHDKLPGINVHRPCVGNSFKIEDAETGQFSAQPIPSRRYGLVKINEYANVTIYDFKEYV